MSDTFLNSFGDTFKKPSDYSAWVMTSNFEIPDDTVVNSGGGTPNFFPFSQLISGTLPGMVNGIFTAPVTAVYTISFRAFGTVADNGAGDKRICQIVVDDDNENNIGPNNNIPIINGSTPKFGDNFIGIVTEGRDIIAGVVQDSGFNYVMDFTKTVISIIKLFDI